MHCFAKDFAFYVMDSIMPKHMLMPSPCDNLCLPCTFYQIAFKARAQSGKKRAYNSPMSKANAWPLPRHS